MQLPIITYTLAMIPHVRLSDIVSDGALLGGEYAYVPERDMDGDTFYTLGTIERINESYVTIHTHDGTRQAVNTKFVRVVMASDEIATPQGVTFVQLEADPTFNRRRTRV